MRRLALYLLISILTFLIGVVTALILNRSDASMIKVAYSSARSNSMQLFELFDRRSQYPERFTFDDFSGGVSIMVWDEKTDRMYCLSSIGEYRLSDW
jgi:hypothetical protein